VTALGFDLLDTGASRASVDALAPGQRALIWLGNLGNADCAAPDYSWTQFTAAVDALAGHPKVFGYFLADEPHPKVCPNAAADIRRRADYIRAHDPSHVSFIVVLDGSNQCDGGYGCEFSALRPAQTHVDLIGLDPYPCNVDNAASGCAYRKIDNIVWRARACGIPASALVPVFQAFGRACRAGATPYYGCRARRNCVRCWPAGRRCYHIPCSTTRTPGDTRAQPARPCPTPTGATATPTCSRCCAHTMPAAKCPGGGTVTLYDVRRHVDELTRPGVDQRHADRVLRCGLPPHVEVA